MRHAFHSRSRLARVSLPRFAIAAAIASIGAVPGHAVGAQDTTLRIVRGVTLSRGTPIAGVNVFDIETLAGAVTRADGQFTIPIARGRTSLHLVARAVGFAPIDTTVGLSSAAASDSITLTLRALSTLLPISVQAGRFTATAERTATLTPLEVANTPGSNADISGALKTLPGVQNVDEGSGLFVRGGDFTETRMFIDGAPLFSAYQFEAPTGSVAGTINPFLTGSITFASGGFGAEWGNALSGVVDLRTQGRSASSYLNTNASILGLTVGGGLTLPKRASITATVGMTDLRGMLALNGNPRDFAPAPHGRIASTLGVWEYRRTGAIKLFGLVQRNAFGVPVVDPALTTAFSSERQSDVVVASWSDSIGRWRPFASVSTSGFARDEAKGAYQQSMSLRSTQAKLSAVFTLDARLAITTGIEVERLAARFDGRFPARQFDPASGAPTTLSTLEAAAVRDAAYLSIDTRPSSSTELIAGVRTSRSKFGTERSADPRASFAWVPRRRVTLTSSWGVYHQVADPAFLDRLGARAPVLPELRADMAIVGLQVGEALTQLRLEAWTKRYADLVGLTREYATVAGLDGRARGADLFARAAGPLGSTVRLTYSLSSSRRADPNTGFDAPAAFDVTSSITVVAQKEWHNGWSAGVAIKRATGRPFTDVAGATLEASRGIYVPTFAAPNGQRLPTFDRTDATISKQLPLGANRFGVLFAGINNILGTRNVAAYTWSRDYGERIAVPSTVGRSLFIGGNLVLVRSR